MTTQMRSNAREQQVIELTSLMMHKYYCENDVEAVIAHMDEQIVWMGVGETEYALGRETVSDTFRRFAGQVPKCSITDQHYHVLPLGQDTYLCSGRMWIATDASTQISLRVHQRITTIFRWRDERPLCCHIHISNPYEDMVEDDVGFPVKIAQQSYQYLQECIEEQKRLIAAQTKVLQRMSYEDAMTGLYNRNRFDQVVESRLEKYDMGLGIACLDLNGLKQVNDQRGHMAGDELIRGVAEQLRQVFSTGVYRIGGDEFVVIQDRWNEQRFRDSVETVRKGLEERNISCSVGISWRAENCDIKAQVDEADRLMYEDKRRFYSRRENDRRK